MIEKNVRRRLECLQRLVLLVESLRERLTPDTEVSEDLRHEIRKLKQYSNDVFYADVKYRVEDIDENTKENAKKEAYKAMRDADIILFRKDPRLEKLMESLEDDDFTDDDCNIQEFDENDDETIVDRQKFEDSKPDRYDDENDSERVIVEVLENNSTLLDLNVSDRSSDVEESPKEKRLNVEEKFNLGNPIETSVVLLSDEDDVSSSPDEKLAEVKFSGQSVLSERIEKPAGSKMPRKSCYITDINGCEHCDVGVTPFNTLISHMERKHVHLRSYKCEECESEIKSKFKIKSHMHRKHVRLRFDDEHCGYELQCLQVSWLVLRSEVDISSINVRLNKILHQLKIDDNFLTKITFRRLRILLLSSVSGKLENCLCGWSCPFPWWWML